MVCSPLDTLVYVLAEQGCNAQANLTASSGIKIADCDGVLQLITTML